MRSLHKIFLLLLVTVISASLLGQSDSARLVGTITDASGAVSPGATVTVTNLGTGRIVSVQTNASGEYVVTELQAGRYHVEVRQTGFKTSTADLTLEVSQIQQISLQLQAGAVDTTV
ncbi:MAG TPA: carboxypeptidase-like regulatory domain-containing protein, partial [Terriglobales bacterium]|nr:carboxypeptidase-like regulatory domain-containing protein [Terriglobales bacterium]